MRAAGCHSIALVPPLHSILQRDGVANSYYLFWSLIKRHMRFDLESQKFECKDLGVASDEMRNCRVVHASPHYITTEVHLSFPIANLPTTIFAYWLVSDERSAGAITLDLVENETGRVIAVEAVRCNGDIALQCACMTDLDLPRTQWPINLLDVYYFQMLKVSPAKPNYLAEVVRNKNPTKALTIAWGELEDLVAALRPGETVGFQYNSDVPLEKTSEEADVSVSNARALPQPYKIEPLEVKNLLAAMGDDAEAIGAISNALSRLSRHQPLLAPERSSHSTNESKFVIKVRTSAKHWTKHTRAQYEFECPFSLPRYRTFAASSELSSSVARALRLIAATGSDGHNRPVIHYSGEEDRNFLLLVAEGLRAANVPTVWLHYHFYLDKHQGGTQSYIRRAFSEVSRQNGVLLVQDADLFFPTKSDLKHLQYGRSAFVASANALFDGFAVVLTAREPWDDSAIKSLVTDEVK